MTVRSPVRHPPIAPSTTGWRSPRPRNVRQTGRPCSCSAFNNGPAPVKRSATSPTARAPSTFSCLWAAVATALDAAGGKNLEILGADVASQCLQRGLVDEILVYVLPVLLGDGVRFSSPGLPRIDLEPISSTQSGAATILRFRVRK